MRIVATGTAVRNDTPRGCGPAPGTGRARADPGHDRPAERPQGLRMIQWHGKPERVPRPHDRSRAAGEAGRGEVRARRGPHRFPGIRGSQGDGEPSPGRRRPGASDAGAGGIDAGEPTSDRLARSPALESLDPRSPTYLYDLLESAIFAEDDGGDPDLWSLGFCVLWVHGLDVETLAAEQSLDLSTRTPCHLSEILDHQIEDGRGAVLLGASRRCAEIPTGRYFRLPY